MVMGCSTSVSQFVHSVKQAFASKNDENLKQLEGDEDHIVYEPRKSDSGSNNTRLEDMIEQETANKDDLIAQERARQDAIIAQERAKQDLIIAQQRANQDFVLRQSDAQSEAEDTTTLNINARIAPSLAEELILSANEREYAENPPATEESDSCPSDDGTPTVTPSVEELPPAPRPRRQSVVDRAFSWIKEKVVTEDEAQIAAEARLGELTEDDAMGGLDSFNEALQASAQRRSGRADIGDEKRVKKPKKSKKSRKRSRRERSERSSRDNGHKSESEDS